MESNVFIKQAHAHMLVIFSLQASQPTLKICITMNYHFAWDYEKNNSDSNVCRSMCMGVSKFKEHIILLQRSYLKLMKDYKITLYLGL